MRGLKVKPHGQGLTIRGLNVESHGQCLTMTGLKVKSLMGRAQASWVGLDQDTSARPQTVCLVALAVEPCRWNHGRGSIAVESWLWNPGCGILAAEPWLWNPCYGILAVES